MTIKAQIGPGAEPDRRRSGRAARRKGNSYELEVAAQFADAGLSGLRRTPNSGGLSIPCDLRGIEGLAIECKRQERLDLWAWLAQAQLQAAPGEIPLLVFRRSRSVSHVCLTLADLLGLLAELRELRGRGDK